MRNEAKDSTSFFVKNTLFQNDRMITSYKSKKIFLHPNVDKEISVDIDVENPKLWFPRSPDLYTLKTEIIQDNKV
ncbi:MAG: hypothetical protein ABF260_04045, partial [Flavobacteriaceae bacterium]